MNFYRMTEAQLTAYLDLSIQRQNAARATPDRATLVNATRVVYAELRRRTSTGSNALLRMQAG